MTSLTSSVCIAFISRLYEYMFVFISREEYYYKGQKTLLSICWRLLEITPAASLVPGRTITTFSGVCYALQTARASSLSSQSSFPVSASLPIANSDMFRPCKSEESEGKHISCVADYVMLKERQRNEFLVMVGWLNLSTWTIFHLPPEQVTGKLNITPCNPQLNQLL